MIFAIGNCLAYCWMVYVMTFGDCSTLMHIGAIRLRVASFWKYHTWCSFSAGVEAAAVHMEVLVVVSQCSEWKVDLFNKGRASFIIIGIPVLRQLYIYITLMMKLVLVLLLLFLNFIKPALANVGVLMLFVCLSVCRLKRVHKHAVFLKKLVV